jgi:hypothetical protein
MSIIEEAIKLANAVVKWFTPRRASSPDHAEQTIQITHPSSPLEALQDKLPYADGFSYKVTGKLSKKANDHRIWLLNENEREQKVWPQGFSPVTDWDPRTGEWSGRVHGKAGETIKIVAVVAPPSAADFFNYYQELCDQGIVKALKRIPPDCTNQASVEIKLP